MAKQALIFLAAILLLLVSFSTGQAETLPNPLLSRGVPAYAKNAPGEAKFGNDKAYYTYWTGTAPDDYLAYDLSAVLGEGIERIDAVWYTPCAYDRIGEWTGEGNVPTDYTVELNAAPGGAYPEDGWIEAVAVRGNTLSSRQHVISITGYRWIRLRITKVGGLEDGACQINFDIHDCTGGLEDSWLFLGDSLTAGGMHISHNTPFAYYLHQMDARYFPIQENGGIGGMSTRDGAENIERWLSTFPGQYVSLAYGTNDAWGQVSRDVFLRNTVTIIEAILSAGKIPVLPTIPFSLESTVGKYAAEYNEIIARLYQEYPQLIPGPDLYSYYAEHPEYLKEDGVHLNGEGYEQMSRLWAEAMYERVYQGQAKETPPALDGEME